MADDFGPDASIETLQERAKILARIRAFFDSRQFFEVQTPALSHDTVVDRFIDPLSLKIKMPGGDSETFWLQTSPEFAMKRLLAAGAESIYQICPAFRSDEVGEMHNLEFTMLEWYRVGDNYAQGMDLLDEFAQTILGCQPAIRQTYQDAFLEYAGIDPFESQVTHDELNLVLSEKIEPELRDIGAVIIYDWPADQAALAKARNNNGIVVAERFELYVNGVELANGYHELTDPDVLARRNETVNRARERRGASRLPGNSRLLDAMRHGLPDSSGVALGVDRLVMLALGKQSISEVMAFNSWRA